MVIIMNEIYVSPFGSDSAEGTAENPLKSLSGVKERIAALKKSGKSSGGIDVIFRGGDYDTSSASVTFGAEESGTEDCPVTFRAYPGEKPLFNAGIRLDLTKAEKVTDPAILNGIIDPSARGGLYVLDIADIAASVSPIEYSYSYNSTAFFRNGSPMYPARYPKKKTSADSVDEETWLITDRIMHPETDYSSKPFTIFSDYGVTDHIRRFWSNKSLKDLYLKGYLWHNWANNVYKIDEIDFDRCTFTVNGGTQGRSFDPEDRKYRRYYLCNILEEIGDHYEYYIDRENGLFYFYPETLSDEIVFSFNTSPSVVLDHADYYRFENLSFSYSVFTPVRLKNCAHFTLDSCEISHSNGDAGISAENCPYFTVKNCRIHDLGSSGVIFYNTGDPKNLISGNALIENNDMFNCGRIRKCYSPCINIWDTVGTVIRGNKLHGNANMVVFMEGIDTLFEYNELYDAVKDSDDAGAIYWGRVAHSIGTVIRYNYFHDIGHERFSTQGIGAIYTDDNATSAEIYGNVFHNAALFGDRERKQMFVTMNATLFLNAAQFCSTHDNIFLMGTKGETPMSDVGHYAFLWWAGKTLGAYIPGTADTLSPSNHWRDMLRQRGMIVDEKASGLWKEHYKDTIWAPMFRLLTEDNYYRGATDENGNLYGIEDIRRKFADGMIDAPTAAKMFDEYTEKVVDGIFGKDYVANEFRNNIIINMDDYFYVPEEHDSVRRTPHSGNMYISAAAAQEYFEDYANGNYRLTEKGKCAVAEAIGDFDNPAVNA